MADNQKKNKTMEMLRITRSLFLIGNVTIPMMKSGIASTDLKPMKNIRQSPLITIVLSRLVLIRSEMVFRMT